MSRFFDLRISGGRIAILSFALLDLASTALAQSPLPSVPSDSVWRQDISSAPVAADSSTVIGWLDEQGGWGSGTLRIDFSTEVLHADGSAPFLSFTPTGDFYDPDCDQVPVPVPAGGAIERALRFILPNSRMRNGVYVHPASHAGGPSGPATAVAYGSRLRLRADYPLETLDNEAARTIARSMQKYGIVLADGGTIALTAQSDSLTTATWEGLGIDAYSLSDLSVTDFKIIDTGPPIALTYDCIRSYPILLDGFELGDLSRWMEVPP